MTRQKLESTAQKTTQKWKKSQPQTVTLATGVGEYTLLETEKLRSHGLKALNDIYILEEEPIDFEVDKPSGMTKEVVEALKTALLHIPETAEFYAKKYPCIGKVLDRGDKTRYKLELGTRVVFARGGVQRDQIEGKDYVFVREADLHAILD